MKIEVKVPSVGESVQEAILAQWYKKDGDTVQKDEVLFVIETDKVTLEITAETDGVLKILVPEGATVAIGTVVGILETEGAAAPIEAPVPSEEPAVGPVPEALPVEAPTTPPLEPPQPAPVKPAPAAPAGPEVRESLSPTVRRLVAEKNLDATQIIGTGPAGRLTKGDVLLYLEQAEAGVAAKAPAPSVVRQAAETEPERPPAIVLPAGESVTRKPMTPIRQRIAARLLEAKQNTAMLTTFNEIDMHQVQAVRAKYKEAFREKYGVSLGLMSFFIKASLEALKAFPEINAFIEGQDIVYHNHYHIGVAVGSERGLVVPIIRHADRLSFAELEQHIVDFVNKINANRLELADLEGGTFTISNGGIYGSLLSTPILNMPQSGILGMHKIEKRPVVVKDEIVIRPMMYVALSYDHRIVDGREAVTFLKRIKECIENPERIMLEI